MNASHNVTHGWLRQIKPDDPNIPPLFEFDGPAEKVDTLISLLVELTGDAWMVTTSDAPIQVLNA